MACEPSGTGYGGSGLFTASADGTIQTVQATRTPPPSTDLIWMESVAGGDDIIVFGVYITNLVNSYVPVLYGCGIASE